VAVTRGQGTSGRGTEEALAGVGVGPRWVLIHMVDEHARHNGHADILREIIDGTTGA